MRAGYFVKADMVSIILVPQLLTHNSPVLESPQEIRELH